MVKRNKPSSPGERVQDRVYSWLNRKHPGKAAWYGPTSAAYQEIPFKLRMIIVFDTVEYNLGNGGWAQLLWNCFTLWRNILADAEVGYRMIGAEAQADEVPVIARLCARDEAECSKLMQRSRDENDFSYFGEFTRRSYVVENRECRDDLFFSAAGVYQRRLEWLAAHEAEILKLIED